MTISLSTLLIIIVSLVTLIVGAITRANKGSKVDVFLACLISGALTASTAGIYYTVRYKAYKEEQRQLCVNQMPQEWIQLDKRLGETDSAQLQQFIVNQWIADQGAEANASNVDSITVEMFECFSRQVDNHVDLSGLFCFVTPDPIRE